ncbi:hypothetical protein SNOG_14556 [Parastagonospora nodorum SN15]|uniref:Major facilitator superfamily (MFS) profile domain-containing protein n=1 Tax=Phaeosphaeria nodorum (strain SN15 / ATCC MYA-4574 / FGSC 10173) TaxID=321614 RepID=Q0U149_PHANO|nr:hypothetical protein SNOG_14556 [Parastagonospora nodorum SN15]EAT78096.1 hypothetical protein SNOG_14556 [Parastagonospora nodorum SN15]
MAGGPSPNHQATRSEIIDLAAMEGHDADIPTNVGSIHQAKSDISSQPRTPTSDENNVSASLEKDLEKGTDAVSTTSATHPEEPPNPNIVDFDGPDDTENPMNWRASKKWGMISLVSVITFLTPLASSMFAPGVPEVMREFNSTSDMLEGFMLSVYVLGFAFGPLIVAPLSEMYGRLPMYHSCNLLFIIFTIAAAVSTSMSQFVVFRFFMGCVYIIRTAFDLADRYT